MIQIHGGVARNVAENIANIELKPTFISAVDDNAMGDDVIQKLKRHKVETKYMKKVKDGMEHGWPSLIMRESGGIHLKETGPQAHRADLR